MITYSTLLGPRSVLGAFLALAILLPVFLAPHQYLSPAALIWLALAVVAFILGLSMKLRRAPNRGEEIVFKKVGLPVATFALIALSGVPILLRDRDLSLGALFAINVLLEVSRDFAIARYHEAYEPPISVKVLMSFGYAAAAIYGYLSHNVRCRRGRFALGLLAFLPLVIFSFLLTSRAVLMYGMVLGFSGVFASRVDRIERELAHREMMIKPKEFIWITLIGAAFLVFFVGVQMVRYGWTDLRLVPVVLSKLQTWMLGHTSAFCYWWDITPTVNAFQLNGQWTFGGLFQMVGGAERAQGIFSEFAPVAAGSSTNVYTAFRALVMDFGVIGGVAFMFLLGLVMSFAIMSLRRFPALAPSIVIATASFVFWSPIASIWAYNSIMLSYVLLYFALYSQRFIRGTAYGA